MSRGPDRTDAEEESILIRPGRRILSQKHALALAGYDVDSSYSTTFDASVSMIDNNESNYSAILDTTSLRRMRKECANSGDLVLRMNDIVQSRHAAEQAIMDRENNGARNLREHAENIKARKSKMTSEQEKEHHKPSSSTATNVMPPPNLPKHLKNRIFNDFASPIPQKQARGRVGAGCSTPKAADASLGLLRKLDISEVVHVDSILQNPHHVRVEVQVDSDAEANSTAATERNNETYTVHREEPDAHQSSTSSNQAGQTFVVQREEGDGVNRTFTIETNTGEAWKRANETFSDNVPVQNVTHTIERQEEQEKVEDVAQEPNKTIVIDRNEQGTSEKQEKLKQFAAPSGPAPRRSTNKTKVDEREQRMTNSRSFLEMLDSSFANVQSPGAQLFRQTTKKMRVSTTPTSKDVRKRRGQQRHSDASQGEGEKTIHMSSLMEVDEGSSISSSASSYIDGVSEVSGMPEDAEEPLANVSRPLFTRGDENESLVCPKNSNPNVEHIVRDVDVQTSTHETPAKDKEKDPSKKVVRMSVNAMSQTTPSRNAAAPHYTTPTIASQLRNVRTPMSVAQALKTKESTPTRPVLNEKKDAVHTIEPLAKEKNEEEEAVETTVELDEIEEATRQLSIVEQNDVPTSSSEAPIPILSTVDISMFSTNTPVRPTIRTSRAVFDDEVDMTSTSVLEADRRDMPSITQDQAQMSAMLEDDGGLIGGAEHDFSSSESDDTVYVAPRRAKNEPKRKMAQLAKRKLITPKTPPQGTRRSTRTRVKPVRCWLGEQPMYANSPSGGRRLVGVTDVNIAETRFVKYYTADPRLALERQNREKAMKRKRKEQRLKQLAAEHKRGINLNVTQSDIVTSDDDE